MSPNMAIIWVGESSMRCPHKTITFLDDERLTEQRVEVREMQVSSKAVNVPVSNIQTFKPCVRVICERCGCYGTMTTEDVAKG